MCTVVPPTRDDELKGLYAEIEMRLVQLTSDTHADQITSFWENRLDTLIFQSVDL